ncbi:Leucine Rich repeats (2 copies) [Reichenbachiella faecimaris]|uniref:Leucine Rich repeats (2 copies) n=1 Tax=Reichenbachiella faecimaris TaxID=692418 RepID=A0A1W2G518_REIFA|nr:leucine-rich repeat domain-containing protein [Reichenbachiella faecimaris]SMD31760.1 Leucine Rich repeats (2 copies) [Reichenbachiella faecimaris]
MKYLFSFILILSSLFSQAQESVDSTRVDEVRSLVNFYEYMLNTIGASKTSTRDKEVIIKESYKKVFKDQFVQIEDDLLLDRKVITNKDVSAYLRDVDFFFDDIQFDFSNIEIEKIDKENQSFYYLVSLESALEGTTIENEKQTSTKQRFIEINLNEESNDLKIASVYSTKVSRDKELELWWESLSFGWVNILSDYVPHDSISNKVLRKMAAIDSLNLSGNQFILDLEPLSALKNLKKLDISNTKISDLSPLRYARNLKQLNASNTSIADISAMQYFDQLVKLDLSQTHIRDISVLERFNDLKELNLSSTELTDFKPIKQLKTLQSINGSNTKFDDPTILASSTGLKQVDLSRTLVDHLFVFQSLPAVEILNLSETQIVNLNGLEQHPALQELSINQTQVKSLLALEATPKLKKVYADLSGITAVTANNFMTSHPQVVVVTNSQQVLKWWVELPTNWKTVFEEIIGHKEPGKEDLAKLLILDSLNISDRKLYIEKPLLKFKRLRYLDISHNDFVSLAFAKEMPDLEYLICTHVPIESTSDLATNKKLKVLNLSRSKLKNMTSLDQLHKLERLDVEKTQIGQQQVIELLSTNPGTVVIFQSDSLLAWWNNLSPTWQSTFDLSSSSSFELHQLIEKQEIEISNQKIQSLAPLQTFINLKSVTLDKLPLTNLKELYRHQGLRSLTYTNGPLQSLEGIDQLRQLQSLNISNTAIEDLKDLYYLSSLKHLNCSRTGLKNLRGIEKLVDLETLDISNTRIWRLDRLAGMRRIKTLTCNNTRISQSKIDDFQLLVPDCEITFY